MGLRNGNVVSKGAGPIYTDALSVRAKMPAPGETVAAMPACDVTFDRDEVAFGESLHVITDPLDHADELVADGHRNGNRFLGPRVPIVNVDIRSADRSLENA